jgi:glycosyltransferase involved in cell wall biosynthesis
MDPVRALVVTNMWPSPAAPALGSFVCDQVDALRRVGGAQLELEVFAFPPGGYAAAARALRRRRSEPPFDIVHAHFGLSAWPALAAPARRRAVTLHGTDLRHPRSRLITRLVLPRLDLVATVSAELALDLPPSQRGRAVVLPCGVATDRFRPIDRVQARAELGLGADERLLLFPAAPERPGKRHDRAQALAERTGARLLALGDVPPERVPLWVNAADAVVAPFEREGFGLAVLEALACDVPVLATPTGIHGEALEGIDGSLCAAWDLERWTAAARSALAAPGGRIAGRDRAERWSADAMARRVLDAWRTLLAAEATV